MKHKSDFEYLINWFQNTHPLTIFAYSITVIAITATLIQRDSFIYIPSGLFYQYTIYFMPIIIIGIIILLQKQSYPNYNSDGDKTWLYRKPIKFRKIVRFIQNLLRVPIITIIIYYSLGVFASFIPQDYSFYAYTTKVSWKDKSHTRRAGTQYLIGTYMTDDLMPEKHKIIYTIVSGLNRNYFLTQLKTYQDMYVNKKITILSKISSFWGEYMYDIDYVKSNKHYQNSTNRHKRYNTYIDLTDKNITKTMLKHQKEFDSMIHQTIKKETILKKTEKVYPKLLNYKAN
jgi:hypothetical protein